MSDLNICKSLICQVLFWVWQERQHDNILSLPNAFEIVFWILTTLERDFRKISLHFFLSSFNLSKVNCCKTSWSPDADISKLCNFSSKDLISSLISQTFLTFSCWSQLRSTSVFWTSSESWESKLGMSNFTIREGLLLLVWWLLRSSFARLLWISSKFGSSTFETFFRIPFPPPDMFWFGLSPVADSLSVKLFSFSASSESDWKTFHF